MCVYTHTPLAKSFYMYVYRVVPSNFPLCESMVPFQLPMNISHSNSNLSMDQPQLLNQHESTIPVSPKTCDGQVRTIIVPQTNKKISFKFQSPPSNKTQNTYPSALHHVPFEFFCSPRNLSILNFYCQQCRL